MLATAAADGAPDPLRTGTADDDDDDGAESEGPPNWGDAADDGP